VKSNKKTHDELVLDLEQRLIKSNRYIHISTFYEYQRKGHTGEVDVLAMTKQGTLHFYEVKESIARYTKANKQYKRFTEAFPDFHTKGILYSDNGARRIYGVKNERRWKKKYR
jgi:RecB family endonuclease NucS